MKNTNIKCPSCKKVVGKYIDTGEKMNVLGRIVPVKKIGYTHMHYNRVVKGRVSYNNEEVYGYDCMCDYCNSKVI